MRYPKVFIVVLNWNNYDDTKECIESLEKITYPNYEIIIIDNSSKDGSTQKIQKEHPKHIYIYNKENLGFTGGTNIGMKYAFERGADYIFFINNDMIVHPAFLEPLVAAMGNKRTGLVGPATYCYPEVKTLYTAGRNINFWKGATQENALPQKIQEVECLAGCFLIKRRVIGKIGYFYEPYFLSFEEIDYCLQARKAGYKVFCEPRSVIWHKVRRTLDKMLASTAYYFYRNKLLFIKRNAPFYIKYPFFFYFTFYLVLKFIGKLVKGEKNMAFVIRDAVIDFWQGNFGKKNIITEDKI